MEFGYAGYSSRGQRPNNDDRLLLNRMVVDSSDSGTCTMPTIFAVCDGCGGYSGGDVAAEMVLTHLSKADYTRMSDESVIQEEFDYIEKEIAEAKDKQPGLRNMCTTIAGCVFEQNNTLIFHSGDSRVYRYDGRSLMRFTKDHSAVQQLIDMGIITEEESYVHPSRNIIFRCLGAGTASPEIYCTKHPVCPTDVFMICSDGAWSFLSSAEIISILSSRDSYKEMAKKLVQTALDNGSDDNVSIIVCGMSDKAEHTSTTSEKSTDKYYLD